MLPKHGLTPMTIHIEGNEKDIPEQWQSAIYYPDTGDIETVSGGWRTQEDAGRMAVEAIKSKQIASIWSRKDRSFPKACWDYE